MTPKRFLLPVCFLLTFNTLVPSPSTESELDESVTKTNVSGSRASTQIDNGEYPPITLIELVRIMTAPAISAADSAIAIRAIRQIPSGQLSEELYNVLSKQSIDAAPNKRFCADIFDLVASNIPFDSHIYDGFLLNILHRKPEDLEKCRTKFFDNALRDSFGSSTSLKIPLITHKIWINDPQNPHEPLQWQIDAYVSFLKKLNRRWKHCFWCNFSLNESTQKTLQNEGVRIFNINRIEGSLICRAAITKLISKKWFAAAANLVKAEVLRMFGGIYTDLGQITNTDLINLHSKYDVIIARHLPHVAIGDKFDPSIIACNNNSRWLIEYLNFFKNINSYDSDYLKFFFNQTRPFSNITGGSILTIFLLLFLEGNKSIMPALTHTMRMDFAPNTSLIFKHNGTASWSLGLFGGNSVIKSDQFADFIND